MSRALRVGLTGGIASGKSAVADALAGHGVILIDSDVLAREVVEPGTPGLAAIVERFGAGVLAADGTLDRAELGQIIFGDDAAPADLNQLIHPAGRARRAEIFETAPDGAVVIAVIPLLVETGIADQFDQVVAVDLPEDLQLERLMARNGYDRDEALARVRSQASRAERLAVADHVIDNSGTPAQTRAQVDRLWRQWQR